MSNILLHGYTKKAIDGFLKQPSQALLLVGPAGSGKLTVGRDLAAHILNLSDKKLDGYPHMVVVTPEKSKSIGIDAVRNLQHFVSLAIPGATGLARIAFIEDAHTMTAEAQNALLKLIEEPPEDTLFILTTTGRNALLPTIVSRTQCITVHLPQEQEIQHYFSSFGHNQEAIQKAWLVSGGLPGLMQALLAGDTNHPLYAATDTARNLLQKGTYERLLMVDVLAVQPSAVLDILFVMQQMAHVALGRPNKPQIAQKWHRILRVSYEASEAIRNSGQTKLVLTDLMLNL